MTPDDTPPSFASPPTRLPESSADDDKPATPDVQPPEPVSVAEGEGPVTVPPELGKRVQTTAATDQPRTGPGRYVLSAEIGRGGMGRVLRGHDPDLGRDVALKVLLEEHAGNSEVVRRFLEEAQINGQLQHPGVVPVYELGRDDDNRPYFTMKLVKGRTLAALLKERPEPGHDRPRFLKIFERICQAVAYAHAKGVIHRDLKPLNVMVGAFGEVQVMDWGLAKVLGQPNGERPSDVAAAVSRVVTAWEGSAESDTRPGSVLGTPAYMPPEQALGALNRLDRRCDVFALGAILCEILTGKPPYLGADWQAVRGKAARADLGDAFARLGGSGADSELVALAKRCLAAEPDDRPADAAAVAETVTAYLAGVEERLRRAEVEWAAAQARAEEEARTRRVVEEKAAVERRARRRTVGLTAALATALAAGTAFSLTFAFEAKRQAKDANDSAEKARISAEKASTKEREANEAREQTEATLARSLLRPLGHEKDRLGLEILGLDYVEGSANDLELDALWELAESSNDRVRLLFVENALETPGKARQLRNQAELALHAAVGLDRQRRERVEGVLLGRLRDASASFAFREEVALAAARASPSSELAAAAARLLCEALVKETDSRAHLSLALGLSAVAVRLGPEEAVRILTEALAKETNHDAQPYLAQALSAVTARFGPQEAAATARILTEALAKTTDPKARSYLADGLSAVVTRLGAEEATRFAAAAARLLSEALAQETNAYTQQFLAEGLSAVAARLSPEEAARHAAAAARLLTEALAKETNPFALSSRAQALVSVAACLSPEEAARLLSEALAKQTNPYARLSLARALSAVLVRLSPEEAARHAAAAAHLLTEALAKETNRSARFYLLQGLNAVAARLGLEEEAATARLLIEALAKDTNVTGRRLLAKELSVVVVRLGPEYAAGHAAAAARLLNEALAKETNPWARRNLAEGLSVVAARLGPEEAARHAAAAACALTEALAKATNSEDRKDLALGLSAVAPLLGPEEAARILSEALAKEINFFALEHLAQGLSTVAARLSPKRAAPVAHLLTEALAKGTNPKARRSLAEGLVAVSVRLRPEEALQRSFLAARAVASAAPLPSLPGMAGLILAAQPLPSRLSTQEVVDLLKLPTCVGPAREPFLKLLGERYNQSFVDPWEFVAYAEKHLPDIDLKAPPKRPGK